MIPGSCSRLNAGAGQCRQMWAACRVLMIWMLIFCQRWRLYKSCCSEGKVRSDVRNFSLWCSPLISQSPIYPTSLFCNMANNTCMHCHLPTHTHTHTHTHSCMHTHPPKLTHCYHTAHSPNTLTLSNSFHWFCHLLKLPWQVLKEKRLKMKHMLHIFLRDRERVMRGQFVWIVYHQNLDC